MATRCSSYKTVATLGLARAGELRVTHGVVPTPAFMPVGTRATVKGVTPVELRELGSHIVLANTYHLWIRPGHKLIEQQGGIQRFMSWDGPVLTDSGGYQVFSLKEHTKVSEEGVRFRSPIDGQHRMLTPETVVEIQESMGVDIAMVLDECIEWPATRERVVASTQRTTRWLERCLVARQHSDRTAMFGIVQGGMFPDVRRDHARELADMDLDGYAIGGLSVGEGPDAMTEMAAIAAAELPTDRVRYLMGVGRPIDIVKAVMIGIDMFDCVIPTRAGRHHQAYTSTGRRNLRNSGYKNDSNPLDPNCRCQTCSHYSIAYLHHLARCGESLGARLLSVHNLSLYQGLMKKLRLAIQSGQQKKMNELLVYAEQASTARAAGC